MEDITLTCKDCGAEFVFTAGEQQFYAEKVLQTNQLDVQLVEKLENKEIMEIIKM